MINKVFLIGRLGKDVDTKYTGAGLAVASFSLATSRTWYAEQQKKQETEWHKCVAFGKLAEVCKDYLHKGSLVHIEGRLKTDSWEKAGVTHYKTQVVVEALQMLDSKGSKPAEREPGDEPGVDTSMGEASKDEVPF